MAATIPEWHPRFARRREVVRRQDAALLPARELVGRLRRAAAARGDLRARQLGACGDLRQAQHRAHLGIPVADAAPSIVTVYRRRLKLKGQLHLTISQSGRSDDLDRADARGEGGRRADGGADQR